jgi:hypothetical protein
MGSADHQTNLARNAFVPARSSRVWWMPIAPRERADNRFGKSLRRSFAKLGLAS